MVINIAYAEEPGGYSPESEQQLIQDEHVNQISQDISAKVDRDIEYKKEQHEKFYDEHPFLKAFLITIGLDPRD
jgi:hypothetical protein